MVLVVLFCIVFILMLYATLGVHEAERQSINPINKLNNIIIQ